jgi:hypothetical protein
MSMSDARVALRHGDIVRVNDSPCEVIYIGCTVGVGRDLQRICFIMDKRTLLGKFLLEGDPDMEFVRRGDVSGADIKSARRPK